MSLLALATTQRTPGVLGQKRHQVDANETKAMEASYNDGEGTGSSHKSEDSAPLCPPATTPLPAAHPTGPTDGSAPPALASWQNKIGLVVGALFFTVVGVVVGRWSATRAGYYSLTDPA